MDELAAKYGFGYETTKAAIDESALGNRNAQPGQLVTLLAKAKADAILKRIDASEGYLLTCDQARHFLILPLASPELQIGSLVYWQSVLFSDAFCKLDI